MSIRYAIRFEFPEMDEPVYAGDYHGALGFAPTLRSARVWNDPDVAARFVENAYGAGAREYAQVVPVPADAGPRGEE